MSAVSSKFTKFAGLESGTRLWALAVVFSAILGMQLCAVAQGVRSEAGGSAQSTMREHYEAAFRFQNAGKTAQADSEYALYLGMVLHKIANGRANLGDYAHAAPLYQEALRLRPDDPVVEIDFASAALDAFDFIRAEALTSSVLDLRERNGQAPDAKAVDELAQAELELGKHQAALEHFELASRLHADIDSYSKLASAYLVLGDKASAAKILNEMPRKFGDTASLHIQLGSLYGGAKFFDAAVDEFKKAIAMDERLKGGHYSIGATYMMQLGEPGFDRAEGEFRKELEVDPADSLVYMPLGRILMSRHLYTEAEVDLKRAAEATPQSASVYLTLGQLYRDMGKGAEAERAFRRSIELTLDPSRNGYEVEQAHFWLGRLLMSDGHTSEGHRELDISRNLLYLKEQQVQSRLAGGAMLQLPLEKTHAANPTQLASLKAFEKLAAPVIASSYDNLAVNAANSGDFANASRNFEQAATWNPALEGIDDNWGRAEVAAKNYKAAVTPLSRSLGAHAENERTRAMLGMCLFMVHDYARVLNVLRPIESKQEAGSPIAVAWAGSTAMTEDPSQGLERLKALEAANPEAPQVHYLLGLAYARGRDYSQSASEMHAELKLDPGDRDAMNALAQADLALGEKAEALDLYTALAQPGSLDGEAFHHLAQLQVDLGLSNDAIATMESAIRINPMDASYHAELAEVYRRCAKPEEAEKEASTSETLRAESEFSHQTGSFISEGATPTESSLKMQSN